MSLKDTADYFNILLDLIMSMLPNPVRAAVAQPAYKKTKPNYSFKSLMFLVKAKNKRLSWPQSN